MLQVICQPKASVSGSRPRKQGFARCKIFRKAAGSQSQIKDTNMPRCLLESDIPRGNSWHEFRLVRAARMTDLASAPAPPHASPSGSPLKLLDQVRQAIRLRHYSRRTESAYVAWIRRFIAFHRKRHPRELGEREVTAFVSNLAARGVNASTQNQGSVPSSSCTPSCSVSSWRG
jgi:Phage integrase, N-terminal SAM-like domain